MVSPYPPYRDGIGSYAVQEVAALRRAGHDVEVLSPLPSAAHHHLPLPSPRSMLALADLAKGYDRVVVQFHPDLFFEQWWGPAQRQAVAHWIERQPEAAQYAGGMPPGLDNPLGARTLYLYQDGRYTLYTLYSTRQPETIGNGISSGCIGLLTQDMMDLYARTPVNTKVIVLKA